MYDHKQLKNRKKNVDNIGKREMTSKGGYYYKIL